MALERVDTDKLAEGHYVSKLDRPWVETPFFFQGFEIREADEIETLRSYCRFVWVDAERSQAPVESTRRIPEERTNASVEREFRDGLAAMSDARELARDACARAMEKLRRQGTFRVAEIAPAVNELHRQVSAYPAVAHWLLNIRDYSNALVDHSVNVCTLSLLIARELGITGSERAEIAVGALLHDVGKTCLPRRLVYESGPLNADDWSLIRDHPVHGYNLLRDGGINERIARIVRHHQERLDRSGFPDGIGGDKLLPSARIVGVANAYDAMTTAWPRVPAISGHQALMRISRQAKARWGNDVVDPLVRHMGIYPAGTHVQMESGAEGVVVCSQPNTRLNPTIVLYRNPRGRPVETYALLDLAVPGQGQRIQSVQSPDVDHSDLIRRVTDQLLAA
jgi:putative nucleotidyltransferase with HDIG domain